MGEKKRKGKERKGKERKEKIDEVAGGSDKESKS
ncbi:MAG: hypothetical protein ACI8RT_001317 [Candidatus Azotimanducaceae bacterium]